MRIGIVSFEYPPETGFGGIGTYSWYQARGLAKLGHDVHVFAGATGNGRSESEHDGVRVTRLHHKDWLRRGLLGLGQRKCWWAVNRAETAHHAYRAVASEIARSGAFDVIEFPECGADGAAITTLLDARTVVKFHSPARLIMGIYDTPRRDRELTAFLEQIAINQATIRTSCSRFLADEVIAKMNVKAPVHVIPNGIDLDLFDRDEGIDVTRRFGIPADGITVFFANRLERRKGVHLVEEVCFDLVDHYPDVRFVFAGADTYGYWAERIQPVVERRGLQKRIVYVGKLDLPEVRAMLKRASIFLLPSLWENCPYSCIEAMAAGRAIVSSDCGGMPELLDDGVHGLLARNDDAASFRAALARAIEDEDLRRRLGAAARRRVEEQLTDVGIARRSVEVYGGGA